MLKAQTVSGKMLLERVEADTLRVGSTSGTVRAVLARNANIQISTISGRVTFGMPEDSGFAYNVDTVSGGVEIGFAHTGNKRHGQVGDASRTVKVSTVSGKVQMQPTGISESL